ncbi:MAG TPA: hypothetical protein VFN90_02635 [Gemmatimonadales bacterium]|nr:hypothetical protein [Gemmatimonadales bacterium]
MPDLLLQLSVALAIGIAAFAFRKRSRSYGMLTLLLGGVTVMLVSAVTDPSVRYPSLLFALLGMVASARLVQRLTAGERA